MSLIKQLNQVFAKTNYDRESNNLNSLPTVMYAFMLKNYNVWRIKVDEI